MKTTLRTIVLVVVAVGIAGCSTMRRADTPAEDAAKELKELEGTWVVEKVTHDGEDSSKDNPKEFLFSGSSLTLKGAAKEERFTLKLDSAGKPRTIDFGLVSPHKTPGAAPGKGAYELDGDTLRLCISPPDRYPTEISDKDQVLFILKRKKWSGSGRTSSSTQTR